MLIRPKNGTKITVEKPSAAWRREEVASMSIMGSKLQDDDEVNIGALIIRIRNSESQSKGLQTLQQSKPQKPTPKP